MKMKQLDIYAIRWYGEALAMCGYVMAGLAVICMLASYGILRIPKPQLVKQSDIPTIDLEELHRA